MNQNIVNISEHTPKEERIPEQAIDWLPLADMVLESYQRGTDPVRAGNMAACFNEAKLGLLVVCKTDGVYYLLDGGHRRAAMTELRYTHALCVVLEGMTYEQRADYFFTQNENSRRLNMFDLYKSGLEAGRDMCVAIDRITRKNGFEVGKKKNSIQCVYTLFTILKVYGINVLDTVLELLRDTWGNTESLILRREFLSGMAEFVRRYGKAYFVEQMKQQDVYKIWRSFTTLYAASGRLGTPTTAIRKAFCASLVQNYNNGMRRNSRKFLNMGDYCFDGIG